MSTRFLILFFLTVHALSHAQPFGGVPPKVKWKQIQTPSFKVIFPEELSSAAARVATLSERILPATAATIGHSHRKINIVLQNETIISNGYVGLAPWRSEFYMTPLSNSLQLGSVKWADMLTLHEIRHVQQFANFRKGLSKFAWIVAGEQGQALANNAAVPDWFYEGDAVFQETLLTEQGRGRLPGFLHTYRAIDEAGLSYSYLQLRNGSYKKLLPNHYSTGYILVAEGRKRFGSDVWKKVTDKAVRFKPLFYPFQGAFKKVTGMRFNQFVKETLYQDSSVLNPEFKPISNVSDRYVKDYSFPQFAGKDSLIVWKQTDRDIPGLYWWINGVETKIQTADVQIDPAFSYKNGKIVFTSYKPDIRWGRRDYSDILLLDVFSGKRKRVTSNGKYFTPDISHNTNAVAAVHAPPSGKQSLHIINSETGTLIHAFSDSTFVYSYPKFSADDKLIYSLVRLDDGKMGILQTELSTGRSLFILEPAGHALSFLSVSEDKLYFTAVYKDRERLFQFDTNRKELHELSSTFAGIQQGIPNGKDSLILTGLSGWGFRLYCAPRSPVRIQTDEWKSTVNNFGEKKPLNVDTLTVSSYTISPYKATANFFNFHSWRPAYDLPDWSITAYGQNILNTVQTEAFVQYNENEGFVKTGFNGAYARWFPWINVGSSYTSGRNALINNNLVFWNEWNLKTGISIPLNLSKGRSLQSLSVSSNYNLQQVNYRDLPKERDIRFGYMDNLLIWSVSSQQAKQHIFPRLGFATAINHRFSVSKREARQFLWRANAYLPGLLKTHNLVVSAAYQSRDTSNQYQFSNSFPLSRGYAVVNLPRMWKLGINYHFPLFYPDFGLAHIVYFSRIRVNVFYDHSQLKSLRTGSIWRLRSAGTEIFFDTKWWNQQPVSLGIRYSRLLSAGPYNRQPNANQFELILPIVF